MTNDIEPQQKQKGFLSTLWKTHMGVAKYVGLFGLPVMLGMLPKAATMAHAANASAGLFSTFTALWTIMGSTIGEFMVPGWSIIFGQLGHGLSAGFNILSGAMAPTATVATPSLIP